MSGVMTWLLWSRSLCVAAEVGVSFASLAAYKVRTLPVLLKRRVSQYFVIVYEIRNLKSCVMSQRLQLMLQVTSLESPSSILCIFLSISWFLTLLLLLLLLSFIKHFIFPPSCMYYKWISHVIMKHLIDRFVKSWRTPVSMSRLSECINSAPTGRICLKFDIGDFY
jgi:hypothetical protein